MTLAELIPTFKGAAKHRGKSGLQLQRELAAAERRIAALTAGIDQIAAERSTAEERLDDAQLALDTAGREIEQLEKAVNLRDKQIEQLQHRVDVGIKAEHFVTETQEIDVRALQERLAEGAVRTLNQSPQARRDPGHVPGWVKDQPEPAA